MKNSTPLKKTKRAEKPARIKKSEQKTAVLLMAYGSPEGLSEVVDYYTHIRHGVRPAEHLIKNLEDRYRQVGGKTPLHEITREQAKALQSSLDASEGAGRYEVFVGMKHWHPFIKDALENIQKKRVNEVVAIALAPHYSKISIGGYQKALDEAIQEIDGQDMRIKLIESWHTNSSLIDCIVGQLEDALSKHPSDRMNDPMPHVIFSAHSLPERIRTWNDPYEKQLLETSELVARKAAKSMKKISSDPLRWSFSFQSAGLTSEPWIGPDILEHMSALTKQGERDILVCPIGFVTDNLEILYDLDIEAQAHAKKGGFRLHRTELRNVHPLFIQALSEEVLAAQKNQNLER